LRKSPQANFYVWPDFERIPSLRVQNEPQRVHKAYQISWYENYFTAENAEITARKVHRENGGKRQKMAKNKHIPTVFSFSLLPFHSSQHWVDTFSPCFYSIH
jgi:hypothetical protein